ncbi:hypothetical protein DH2020_042321 [Rehmannia glutinosa]|uniref:Rho termination factor-like N-terminal domain-containing protein n=1 Tax=Rehmannia glutinosa TaxID=99300 RepID=A0ABR0UNV8_REHGL
MEGSLLYPHSVLRLPSLSRPNLRKPFFSLKETADRPFVSSIRANGNRVRPPKAEGTDDGKSSLSPNKEEILALFKRIQSSISKGENTNSKKRNSKVAEDKTSAESILEILHQSRTRGKGKTLGKKGDKSQAPQKDSPKKEEEKTERLSTTGLQSTRPPSKFTRRSPVPTLSSPRDNVQPGIKTSPETATLSIPRDEIELKTEQSKKFEEMKLPQLKEVAKSKGIKGYSKLKKSELVELLVRSLNNSS